ncbi:MAG: hypothetical protein RLZZ04_975, partial [Cyanobacteriota bacterium]
MKVIHGTWIPEDSGNYIQPGSFYLWVETSSPTKRKGKSRPSIHPIHPAHLAADELGAFLSQELGIKDSIATIKQNISSKYFVLPTANNQPLPCPELAKYLETEIAESYDGFEYWQIDCYQVVTTVKTNSYQNSKAINIVKLLKEIHFLALYNSEEIQLGSDLLFWYHYTQAFSEVILKDQYIPALKYRQLSAVATKGKKKTQKSQSYEIYATWSIISEQYEADLQKYGEYMPLICLSGANSPSHDIEFCRAESLLRHFSEYLLQDLVTHTPSTAAFDKKIENSLIHHCFYPEQHNPLTSNVHLEEYQQWLAWKEKITRTSANSSFHLCFQLHAAEPDNMDNWQIQFLAADKQDPSLKLALGDYWLMNKKAKAGVYQQFGQDFTTNLLLNLGYAAKMYPKLWQGMETTQPDRLRLTLTEAFDFLQESAWVLESAGFKIIVPAWYTPAGRRRAKMRLKASSSGKSATKTKNKGYFNLDSLVEYQYQLAIGDEQVTTSEWQQLVNAKTPLVHFRGQWMELDRDKMQEFLEFWQAHGDEKPKMTMLEFLQRSAEAGDDWEVEHDESLSEMMEKLQDKSQFEPVDDLEQLQGTLREYQKRGVSWLSYLEQLGINGCLADDMGLGKSIQVIARLVQEREFVSQVNKKSKQKASPQLLPTLLIAPTSVVGNWLREIAKFAPQLKARVHHGSDRLQDLSEFKADCLQQDIVITSFTLARKDAKLLGSLEWQRIVLDEAQNIKNPKAAQTKAILKLSAQHRLALTGTPVENRLLDLWSIFNFL